VKVFTGSESAGGRPDPENDLTVLFWEKLWGWDGWIGCNGSALHASFARCKRKRAEKDGESKRSVLGRERIHFGDSSGDPWALLAISARIN
jgi:hypothetical protein